jgi:magnesium transporter
MVRPFRYTRKRRDAPGSPPGRWTADPEALASRIHAFRYAADGFEEADTVLDGQAGHVLWLNIDGLRDEALLNRIATDFGLHPLAMEDVVHLHQRPKVEAYDDHLFVVLRMPRPAGDGFATEQVTLFLGPDFVITFQERPGDVFEPVRTRLRNPHSKIRERGADYLAYALIDAVTDAFFPVLDQMGERLETLEDAVLNDSMPEQVHDIHAMKHELMAIRRAVWPMRDSIASLLRDDGPLISDQTGIYLRDCQDHTFQLIDTIDTYREIASGLVDLHLSSQSNRMNEVMQVLTLIATIFIPLTFIVGVYGMNFDDMPELHLRWGYPAVMAFMAVIGVGLALWFRHKGWLGRRR